jgi:hypothetical protein
MTNARLTCLALLTGIFMSGGALAAEGQLNAISQKPIPAGKILSVRALDDSDESLALKDQFVRELTNRGYRVQSQADLVLTFEIQDELGAYTFTDKRYILDLQTSRGTNQGIDDDSHAKFNVFNSKTGGILNKGQGGTKIVTPTKYRLKVTVDGPAEAGRIERYWQGWATGKLGAATNEALIGAMVAPLVDSVGKTVKDHTITLPD